MEYRKSKLNPGDSVWIYARHSPGPGQSIASQLNALRQYCSTNGLNIVEEFIDEAVSGTSLNRSAFTRMRLKVEASQGRLVRGIICFDSSRFARNSKVAEYVKALLRFKGYAIEFLDQEYTDDLPGRIVEVIDDHENAKFIEKLALKTKQGLRTFIGLKDASGDYLGTWPIHAPWGYKPVQKEIPIYDIQAKQNRIRQCIEPDYDLWPLGQQVFRLRAEGLTYRQIEEKTRFMTNRGVDVTNQDMLGRMYMAFLRNPIYKGEFRYKEIVIPNYVPAMVSEELWRAANLTAWNFKRGNWNGNRYPKTGKGNPIFTLAGLCKCAYCNALCYPISQKQYRYYVCSTRRRAGVSNCPQSMPPNAGALESLVYHHTLDTYLSEDFIFQLTAMVNILLADVPDNEAKIKRLDKDISDLTRRINNLLDLAEEGDDVGARLRQLGQKRQDKENERQQLLYEQPQPLQTDAGEVSEIFTELRQRLLNSGEIRPVFYQIIDHIKVAKDKATVYYRMPLYLADSLGTSLVDKLQLEYTIVFPSAKRHADATTV